LPATTVLRVIRMHPCPSVLDFPVFVCVFLWPSVAKKNPARRWPAGLSKVALDVSSVAQIDRPAGTGMVVPVVAVRQEHCERA